MLSPPENFKVILQLFLYNLHLSLVLFFNSVELCVKEAMAGL